MEAELPPKKFWDLLAFIISAIFSPYVMAGIFILLITYTFAQNVKEFLPWIGIEFLFAILIPGSYVVWLLERRLVRDVHLSDHDERKTPFLVAGISAVLGAASLALVGAAKPVILMGVVYAVNTVAIGILTLFWKVSVHTALFSSVMTVVVILFGAPFAWGYLFLIPLAWSRVYRHRHSLNQVIGGALITFVLTSLVFWLYGYI